MSAAGEAAGKASPAGEVAAIRRNNSSRAPEPIGKADECSGWRIRCVRTRVSDYMRQRHMAAAEARSRGCLCSVVVNALEYKLNEKTRRKRRNADSWRPHFRVMYKSSHFMNNRQPNRKIIECGLDLTCKFKLNNDAI